MRTRHLIFLFFLAGLLCSCGAYRNDIQIVNIEASKVLPGRAETKPYYEIKLKWTAPNSCDWRAKIYGFEKKVDHSGDTYRLRLESYEEGASIFIYCLGRPNRKTKLILPPLSRPITRQ